jgi:Domain of unknown function (DUF4337)
MEDPEVPTEHLHEQIHEAAEHTRQRWTLGVALSSALLAGFAAVASLMAGHEANEAMLSQISSANQWNYFQAKGIKEAQLTSKADILEAVGKPFSGDDKAKIAQYEKEKTEIQNKAEALQQESEKHLGWHSGMAKSVTFFQIAIAVGAISVLMRRPAFWLVSLLVGAAGVFFFAQTLILRNLGSANRENSKVEARMEK